MITRTAGIGLALLTLAACGDDSRGDRGYWIAAREPEIRASLASLAQCPSPLDRLGIAREALRIGVDQPGEVTITIPAAQDIRGSVLRFDLDAGSKQPDAQVHVTWSFDPSGSAAELDLGEKRLLNPARLDEELDSAVSRYLNYDYQRGQHSSSEADLAADRGRACRSFGRIADAYAVMTNPGLRAAVERQKRRDALGWLFFDNYQLKTDSPDGAYWEAEPDYNPADNPYSY